MSSNETPVIPEVELNLTDIVSELGKDDNTPDEKVEEEAPKKEAKSEDKETSEEGELELTDESVETPEEEPKLGDDTDEEKLTYQDIPRRQVILKEFPELFKKFPSIEHTLYREKQYAEIFPTVKDAKTANEQIQNYKELESKLNSGSIDEILQGVGQANPEGLKKITRGILKTLSVVDKDAYFDNINHIITTTIKSAFDFGGRQGSEDGKQLQIAAQILSKFLYGTGQVPNSPMQEQPQNTEITDREKELKQREQRFAEQQLSNAADSVKTKVESVITNALAKSIDPRNQMSAYVKGKAQEDAFNYINNELQTDARFQRVLSELWTRAVKKNFSEPSLKEIRDAVYAKAQGVLPDAIRKVRTEALKGMAAQKREVSESKNEKPIVRGRPASSNVKQDNKGPREMTVSGLVDFLGQD